MKERNSVVDRKENTKGMPRKEQVAIYIVSELGIRVSLTAPRLKGSAIHHTPPATTIYPSTTYCRNAKKLKTRE
jgi:hypothetical protein